MNRTDEPGEPPNRQQAHNSQRKEKTSMNKKTFGKKFHQLMSPFLANPPKDGRKPPAGLALNQPFFGLAIR